MYLFLLFFFIAFFIFLIKLSDHKNSTRNVKLLILRQKPKAKKTSPEPSDESRDETPVPERKPVEPARKKPEPEADIPVKKKVSVPKIQSPEKSPEKSEEEEEDEEMESSPPRERSGSEGSTEGEVSRLNYEIRTKDILSDKFWTKNIIFELNVFLFDKTIKYLDKDYKDGQIFGQKLL